jgi:hypothetical protein
MLYRLGGAADSLGRLLAEAFDGDGAYDLYKGGFWILVCWFG